MIKCLGGGQGRRRNLVGNWKNIATFSQRHSRHLWSAGNLIDAWHLNEALKRTKSTGKHRTPVFPSSLLQCRDRSLSEFVLVVVIFLFLLFPLHYFLLGELPLAALKSQGSVFAE